MKEEERYLIKKEIYWMQMGLYSNLKIQSIMIFQVCSYNFGIISDMIRNMKREDKKFTPKNF